MKSKDRIKEEIGFDKLLLTIFIATISSISSWTLSNMTILPRSIIMVIGTFLLIFGIIAIITFSKIKLKILELDKYES